MKKATDKRDAREKGPIMIKQRNQEKITVGYIRCSTMGQVQDGETLARQEALIRAHCAHHGIHKLEIVADEGLSGFKVARPGFQRLIRLCNEGKVTAVVVTDLSRLSRSVRDTLWFVDEIVQAKSVRLVSLTQDIDTGNPFGRAFLTFLAVFAQLYRDDVAFKTRAALSFKRSKGEKTGGNIPFGYDVIDKRLVVNDTEIESLRLIYSLRSAGLSLRSISRELTQRAIPSKTGAPWSHKVIWRLLKRVEIQETELLPNGADGTNGNGDKAPSVQLDVGDTNMGGKHDK